LPQTPEARARDLLASAVSAQGTAWKNLAGLIRSGFVNIWITPALAVIAALIVQVDALSGEEE
jgi:hypothetical protein